MTDRKIEVLGPVVDIDSGREMSLEEYRRFKREHRYLAQYEGDRFGLYGFGETPRAAIRDLKTRSRPA